jgi:hypothetical protein
LWERSQRKWVPFPVFVPLVGVGGTSPEDALVDLLLEEIGVWPEVSREPDNGSEGASKISTTDQQDADLETLTETAHQGELDRLAVTASILRRRIRSRALPVEYVKERLEMLRRDVDRIASGLHIRRALLAYLSDSHRSSRP